MNFTSVVPEGSEAMTCSSSCVVGIFSFRFLLVDSHACIALCSRKDARVAFTSSAVLGGGTTKGGQEWEGGRGGQQKQ